MEKDRRWLEECRRRIELELGWEYSHHWGNGDFELLSEKLWEKTRIRLSVSTLKRIWGRVRYDNFPNSVTLNALAGFLGYAHWRDFCQQHPIQEEIPTARREPIAAAALLTAGKRTGGMTSIRILVAVVLTGLFAWLIYSHLTREESINAADFKFTSKKVTGDLPNSVVFDYDATAANWARVIIQQSWDTGRREIVAAKDKQHTSIYYYPGYFMAKLLVGERVIKESPVFIQTKGWKGIIGKLPLPLYLGDQDVRQGKTIGVSESLLKKKMNSSDFNGTWTEFAMVHEFPGIDAQDFILDAVFSNTSTVEESLCREVKIEILGTENAIIIPFSAAGCIANLNVFTGDETITGKDHDLSAFGCDYSRVQKLQCVVHDRTLKISLNNRLIMTSSQQKTLGRIVGLRMMFEGAGRINSTILETPGKKRYDLIN